MSTSKDTWQGDESLNLHALIVKLWSKRLWIGISVVCFAAVFTAVAVFMTPVYRATTVLVSARPERDGLGNSLSTALGSLGGIATLAGINATTSDAGTEEALAVLQSRVFNEAFIVDNNLVPKLATRMRGTAASILGRGGQKELSLAKAFKFFSELCTIRQDKKTGLITVQVDWIDRFEATVWVNKLVERVNEEMRSRAFAKANASVGYLEKELASTTVVETREAINRLIESQVKQRMLANVTRDYAFRVVDPAMAPDVDDPIRPQRLLLIVLGPFIGLLVGAVIVMGQAMFTEPLQQKPFE